VGVGVALTLAARSVVFALAVANDEQALVGTTRQADEE